LTAAQAVFLWQPVRPRDGRFHLGDRLDRFNPQTQILSLPRLEAEAAPSNFSRPRATRLEALARTGANPAWNMATVETTTATRHAAAPADAIALVGRLGPWQLVRQLAEGNFTRVYQARPADALPNQSAAYTVKVLRHEWWRDPQAIEMQRREAWVGSKVSHPNLLPVLSASVTEPPFYVVAPKLDGAPLSQLIAEQEQLPLPVALWYARQVADGLDALFNATGMIHTDVKPANILVSPAGHATLIDFGFVQTPAEASQWATRPLAGTLAYIAPEMVTSALAAGPRSDIYSLGVTLYEMITGRRPWESDDPGELAMLHRQAKPNDIRALRPDVPDTVGELIHAMLAKDPLRRPGSARELATKLMRLEIECFTLR
jgi:serine/threonine-protein kinase